MVLQYKNLKQANYTSPQFGDEIIPRYVIENETDLERFSEKFEFIFDMVKNLRTAIKDGRIIILTDTTRSGYTSYCFESKKDSKPHPSNWYRVN